MTGIAALLDAIATRRLPDEGVMARTAAAACWPDFLALLATVPPPVIYGANTLPGHRMADATAPGASAINRALFESHLVAAEPPWLAPAAVGGATLAKLMAIASGHVPVRPETADMVIEYFRNGDWTQAQVPAAASYGCGDVVPAAHWLAAVLRHSDIGINALGPGEAMALVNGNFIAVGAALTQLSDICALSARVMANEAWLVELLAIPRALFAFHRDDAEIGAAMDVLAEIAADEDPVGHDQLPVSIRSIPQMLAARHHAIGRLAGAVRTALSIPSGNPLFDPVNNAMLSQASFLALDVSLALSAAAELFLAQIWVCTERCKFLSARFGEQLGSNPVATIQVVKQMQAQCEEARRTHGSRLFASGSSTSAGIEDFWGYTLPASQALGDLITRLNKVLAIEARLLNLWRQPRADVDHWPDMAAWWVTPPPTHPRDAVFSSISAAILAT